MLTQPRASLYPANAPRFARGERWDAGGWFIIKNYAYLSGASRTMIRFLQTEGLAKKIIFIVIIGVSCIAMVIMFIPGINDTSSVNKQGVYATVSGRDITTDEINQDAQRMMQQRFPRGGVPEGLSSIFRVQAANQLVTREALTAEAHRMGLRVTDEELIAELKKGQFGTLLFPSGTFVGEDQYEQWVSNTFHMSVNEFESLVKEQLLIDKLLSMIENGVTVPMSDLQQAYQEQNTKVKFDYAVLNLDDITKQVKVTDAEARDYFEKNKPRYAAAIPETRKLQYLVIDTANLPVQVTDADLQKYYQDNQDQFRVKESVDVRHILIKTPEPGPNGQVDPAGVAAAKAKAEDILKKLRAGADFAETAKEYSDDPGSKTNGGLYQGVQKNGQLVKPFEDAAFSLPVGKISDIVQTIYGFHILKVEKHTQAHLQTLDEVKAQIEPLVKRQKMAAAAEALINKVEADAQKNGLEKAAAKNNLPLMTTGYVARTDTLPGIGISPEFMSAAFSAAANSPALEVKAGDDKLALVQVQEIKPPAPPTFDAVKDQVMQDLQSEQAQELLEKKSQELVDRARAEHDLKKAAKEVGAKVLTSDLVAPNGQVPEFGSMNNDNAAVFDLQQGQIGGPFRTATGEAVVFLLDKQLPDMTDFEKQKDQIREQVLDQKRQEVRMIFIGKLVDSMEKSGKIKYNATVKKQLEQRAAAGGPLGE